MSGRVLAGSLLPEPKTSSKYFSGALVLAKNLGFRIKGKINFFSLVSSSERSSLTVFVSFSGRRLGYGAVPPKQLRVLKQLAVVVRVLG